MRMLRIPRARVQDHYDSEEHVFFLLEAKASIIHWFKARHQKPKQLQSLVHGP